MKILAIRLHNLASLAGEHAIDFAAGPLADSGLFAITGPTGAGKSTLLDALCLALYGNTPRLRQAPSRDSQAPDVGDERLTTADPRTLLRRGTASGYAEVDFVGRDGERYRARWSVRRARNRPDGRLQAVEQALIELPGGRVLASQKRDFERLLPQRLGLNFDQFTRAVLLAQSEFSAFLKADDNARSELLERLTDTGIYSRISIAAYQRAKQAAERVREVEARLDGEPPAETAERAALEEKARDADRDWQVIQQREKALHAEQAWLDRELGLREAWQQAERESADSEQEWRALGVARRTLERLETLAAKRHDFHERDRLARQADGLGAQLAEIQAKRQASDTRQAEQDTAFQAADSSLAAARQAQRDAQPALQAASESRQRLDYLTRELDELDDEHRRLGERRATLNRELDDQRRQRQLKADELAALEQRLGGDPEQARLALQARHDEMRQRHAELDALRHAAQRWQALDCEQRALDEQQRLDLAQQKRLLGDGRQARSRLDACQQDAERCHASIQRLRAARSERVEALRAQLEAEHPCPVCGSREHPYRHAPSPSPDQAALAASVAEEDRQLAEVDRALATARDEHQRLSADYQALRAQCQQRQRRLAELSESCDGARRALDALPLAAEYLAEVERDAGRGTPWLDEQLADSRRQRDALAGELTRIDDDRRRQQPLREALNRHDLAIGRQQSQLEPLDSRLGEIDRARPPRRAQRADLERDIAARLGVHASIEAWRQALDQACNEAQQHADQAREARDAARLESQRLAQQQHDLMLRVEQTREAQRAMTAELSAWQAANPEFDDATLNELLAMDDASQRALRERVENAHKAREACRVRAGERRSGLLDHRCQGLDEIDRAVPENDHARLDRRREQAGQAREALVPACEAAQQQRDRAMAALHDDDRRRARQQELQATLTTARDEHRRWGRISELIGSADGKAFRRIAQAYNLEQLLAHANQHLTGLTRRYRLARGGSPLGLLVVDTEMGDEQRSVHSLSGGETFLVSLALALGLASMASGKLRIETLFIDEGFGSLDPHSLALAMEALDGLQAQGRKVGVISHVQEMHERIPVRILVEPLGNGTSRARLVSG
ncbi:AAA family ATPase [Halomonas sp. HP20-15]|uniref:AAA family ATPase n=1 Tax=Halomonas sp. HP20-15 TaxID=3085901 RepID=UPI0029815213|nr:AAA family ATPase [Halomonas sp. HP20-15]MDW5376575.1 AAA family ATPase [Halomonas sp. HP20-15]